MPEEPAKTEQDRSSEAPSSGRSALPAGSERPIKLLSGTRQVSFAALHEQVAAQFLAETPEEILLIETAVNLKERIKQVLDYVLEVTVIRLSRPEKTELVEAVYSDVFGFGPLDSLLTLPDMREIAVDGPDRLYVQVGTHERESANSLFESADQLESIVGRLLKPTGASYSEQQPFVEVGRVLLGRRVRIMVAAPPATPTLTLELRLHPLSRPGLPDLIATSAIDPAIAQTIRDNIGHRKGMMIVGDAGSGKTTLLEALLPLLPAHTVVVQRAEECDVPDDQIHLYGPEFGPVIEQAVALGPPWLVLDEVRFDEGEAILRALLSEDSMGQAPTAFLWAFRGSIKGERLLATFGMSLRRARPTLDQSQIVDILVRAFPLVIAMGRIGGAPGVVGVFQWVLEGDHAILKPLQT